MGSTGGNRHGPDTQPNLLDLGAAGASEQAPLRRRRQRYFPRRVSLWALLLGPLLWCLVEPVGATKVSEKLLPWERSLSSILPEMLQVLENLMPLVSVRCFFVYLFVFFHFRTVASTERPFKPPMQGRVVNANVFKGRANPTGPGGGVLGWPQYTQAPPSIPVLAVSVSMHHSS